MVSIFLFTILYVAALVLPIWVFVASAFFVALYKGPYIPLIIAVLVEFQFGFIDGLVLWYLAATVGVCVMAEVIRPHLDIKQFA